MEYFIFVTASRTDAIGINARLKEKGIKSSVVSTPKEAGLGCGLSVKIPTTDYFFAIRVINQAKKYSVKGVYKVSETPFGKTIKRL